MKKVLGYIKTIVGKTATYFMFVILLFSTFITLVSPSKDIFMIDTAFLWFALLFAFIMALDDLILSVKIISVFALKVALHYIVAAADFILVLCILSGAAAGSQVVIVALGFSLIYALVMTVYCVIRAALMKKENKEKEYTAQFTPEDKK